MSVHQLGRRGVLCVTVAAALAGCGDSTGGSDTDAGTGTDSSAEPSTSAGTSDAQTSSTGGETGSTTGEETTGATATTTTETGSTSTGEDTESATDSEGTTGDPPLDLDALMEGLEDPYLRVYEGAGDGGLGHVTYFGLDTESPEFLALEPQEQAKVVKIQATSLHSALLQPTEEHPGAEVTGALEVTGDDGVRRQELTLKLPSEWNGRLVVLGAPGTRSEFSNEAVLTPWLLARGYAIVSGNKGMTNAGADGNATMLNQAHPTAHWGEMMIDMGLWAQARLEAATQVPAPPVYAAGLSNGGYQVRRALELDHLRVGQGEPRLFAGGLDRSGAYWPDARAMDTDDDQEVSPAEFAAANHLVSTNERAALTMGWLHAPDTLNTPAGYAEVPPYSAAHPAMLDGGFSAESALIWGAYSSTFDYLKDYGLTEFKGVGYYNITAYVFRAELLGHDAGQSLAYSCYSDGGDEPPPFYPWLEQAQDGGWTPESVTWALRNANTGEFSAPLISVHGQRDGLLGLQANAIAYEDAILEHGDPDMFRLYVIEHGGHVDLHSDGGLDFDANGMFGDEGAADSFTIMQPYAERAFDYLVAWVEDDAPAPPGKLVATDPVADELDASQLSFE